jgi:Zn-dependent protease
MLGLRHAQERQPRARVRISRGGIVPVALLAVLSAAFASSAGVSVAAAALVGGIGGTASLLVHELGHVRAARRLAGIESAEVSLIWLGALTRFGGRYGNGREQARVAIAGPQASFAFAGALLLLCALPFTPFRGMVFALALFNVLLAFLNLVPVYPLDGYKVAVGLLWATTGSEAQARRLLRRIGIGWAAIEVPAAVVLAVERPHLGFVAAVLAGALLIQKRLASTPAEGAERPGCEFTPSG